MTKKTKIGGISKPSKWWVPDIESHGQIDPKIAELLDRRMQDACNIMLSKIKKAIRHD